MQHIWLDWSHPFVPAAADWLISRGRETVRSAMTDPCDLSDWLVVTPGRRGGQELLAAIIERAGSSGAILPPRMATPGLMVDLLVEAAAPAGGDAMTAATASELESHAALAGVLRSTNPAGLQPLLTAPPEPDDWLGWLGLAKRIEDLHVELVGGRKRFADVAHAAETLELFREADRWRVLADVFDRYVAALSRAGLADAHHHRRLLVEQGRIGSSQHIALVGVVEMNALQRALVAAADKDASSEVVALVHCAADEADGFDDVGCVKPDAWSTRDLPVAMDTVTVADMPSDQAQAVVRGIAAVADTQPAEAIIVGLGDEALEPFVEHAGTWAGIRLRSAAGRPAATYGPLRLLEAVAAWLEDPRFARFAALLRHADVERFVQQRLRDAPGSAVDGDREQTHEAADDARAPAAAPANATDAWLGLLDRYFNEHLQVDVSSRWLGSSRRYGDLRRVHAIVHAWLAPLGGTARPLGDWAQPILGMLDRVYGELLAETGHALQTHRNALRDVCRMLRDQAGLITQVDPSLMPTVNAATALRYLADRAGRETIPLPRRPGDVETLGWLELHLDTSPVLILAGVNDGAIPSSATADAFLPDALRARLGLLSNARRYARDAYLLEALLRSRDHVRLITGRRSTTGEPLAPSRLLLTCAGRSLAQRVLDLTNERTSKRWMLPLGASLPADASGFVIPRPPDGGLPCTSMRVTDFRAYLTCPYRYWLERIQGIEVINDSTAELDALQFGSVAHDVLEQFGHSEMRDSTDAHAIAAFLRDALNRYARAQFGRRPPAAVQVQLLRMALRLDAFAEVQAAERTDGWRIEQVEYALPAEAYLDMGDDAPVQLRGKIDRIDRHEQSGQVRVLDYKTSETAMTPEEAHWRRKTYNDTWIDLQLPLYHELLRQTGETAPIDIGYFILPGNPAEVSVRIARRFTDDVLAAGVDCARQVVRDIRAGRFDPNPKYHGHDAFDRILQVSSVATSEDSDGDDDGDNEGGAA